MITEVFISIDHDESDVFPNGLNIKINRCDSDAAVTFILVDDGEKAMFHSFEILYSDLVRMMEKLKYESGVDKP
jgi:hypothetical protein